MLIIIFKGRYSGSKSFIEMKKNHVQIIEIHVHNKY